MSREDEHTCCVSRGDIHIRRSGCGLARVDGLLVKRSSVQWRGARYPSERRVIGPAQQMTATIVYRPEKEERSLRYAVDAYVFIEINTA